MSFNLLTFLFAFNALANLAQVPSDFETIIEEFTSPPANCSPFRYKVLEIQLEGYIEKSDLLEEEIVGGVKEIVLVLSDVTGGMLKNAERFSERIQDKCALPKCKITTIVPPEKKCSSACLVLFMAGHDRIAYQSSTFGFHAGSKVLTVFNLPLVSFKSSKLIKKFYRKSGISKKWMRENNHLFRKSNITYLMPKDLEGSNLVTEIREDPSKVDFDINF